MKIIYFVLLILLLNCKAVLAQAPPSTIQVPSAPSRPANPTDSVPLQSITTTPSTTAPSTLGTLPTGGGADVNTGLGTEKGSGKYQEYQSICRRNDYDIVSHFSDGLRTKRIQYLKDKISEAGEDSVKIELRLAKEYIDQYETDAFNNLAKQLKSRKLSQHDNQYLNALMSFSNFKLSVARTTLVELVKDAKDDRNKIEALQLLAEVYMAEDNLFEATAAYEDLNKITKNAYLVQQCESMILNSLNAEGEAVCQKAVEKFSDNPFPLIYIGISQREREDFKKAHLSFKRALSIKPTEMGYTCLAELYFMKDTIPEAVENFKKSLAVNPASERAILGLAWAYIKAKNYEDSIKQFRQACKINSKHKLEIRRAFKELSSQKINEAKDFANLAVSCGR